MKATNYLARLLPLAGAIGSCVILLAFPATYSPGDGYFVSGNETKLRNFDCGRVDIQFNAAGVVKADPISGAESYKFKFIRLADTLTEEYTSADVNCDLYYVNAVNYGYDYSVLVKAKLSGVWLEYGDTCYISMLDSIPAPKLRPLSCNKTGFKRSGIIHSSALITSDDHEFLFIDTLRNQEIVHQKGGYNYALLLRDVKDSLGHGLRYNTNYEVFCRTKVKGTWSEYGESCFIGMDTIPPTTKLHNNSCENTSVSSTGHILAGQLFADDYQYVFTNHETLVKDSVIRGSSSNILPFNVTGISFAQCQGYSVIVRALYVDQWSEFGESCNFWTTCGVPLTKLDSTTCNQSSLSLAEPLFCDSVANADSVRWQFIEPAMANKLDFYTDSFSVLPDTLDGLETDSIYAVRVFAKVSGQWGVSRDTCWVSFVLAQHSNLTIDTEVLFEGLTLTMIFQDTTISWISGNSEEVSTEFIIPNQEFIEMAADDGRETYNYLIQLDENQEMIMFHLISGNDTLAVTGNYVSIENNYLKILDGSERATHTGFLVFPKLYKGMIVSPNGDGFYDEFEMQIDIAVTSYSIEIRDLTDNLLFISNDYKQRWDCTDSTQALVPVGTYRYQLELNGESFESLFYVQY